MRTNELLLQTIKRIHQVRDVPRAAFLFSSLLGLVLLLACSSACAPDATQGDGKQSGSAPASDELPELTEAVINEQINDTRVREIPEENGNGEPISWRFIEKEPKEVRVVEKQVDGTRANVVLDIKTKSSPDRREQRYLAGQIRTMWELRTGWVIRKWEIVKTENISMKYKNLPKPPAQNSNR